MLKETSFLIPRNYELNLKPTKGDRTITLNNLGYSSTLDKTKNKISTIKYSKWTSLRKLVNDFEFPYDKTKIQKPISRAFFKLLEMLIEHSLDINCNTLHLAEAPGGFIECCLYYKNKYYNELKQLYTFSLHDPCKDIPNYQEKIRSTKDVIILSNKDNKGDLYNLKNVHYLIQYFKDKQIKFITCDGGFAEKNDFASKEHLHHKLIFHQLIASLFILETNGTMIIKFFDIFTELTFDFLCLLSYLFEKVYICKPHTSRPTNSEKYIVCKFYCKNKFTKISSTLRQICVSGIEQFSCIIDKSKLRNDFTPQIRRVNLKLSEYQIYCIENILTINKLNLKITKSKENIDNWVKRYLK